MTPILRWILGERWHAPSADALLVDYQRTFGTPEGQRVLRHLVETNFFPVYGGLSAEELWQHNGRRSLVQELLENLQTAKGVTT